MRNGAVPNGGISCDGQEDRVVSSAQLAPGLRHQRGGEVRSFLADASKVRVHGSEVNSETVRYVPIANRGAATTTVDLRS